MGELSRVSCRAGRGPARGVPGNARLQDFRRTFSGRADAQLDLWRKGGGVLLATQGTGGYGLTLTEADHVFFFSENWKYALRIQAEDRCHRIGQKRSVHYVTLPVRVQS